MQQLVCTEFLLPNTCPDTIWTKREENVVRPARLVPWRTLVQQPRPVVENRGNIGVIPSQQLLYHSLQLFVEWLSVVVVPWDVLNMAGS